MNPLTPAAYCIVRLASIALLLPCVMHAQRSKNVPTAAPFVEGAAGGADRNGVTVVAQTVPGARLSTFVGRSVRDRAGQALDSIRDMYIDADTGKGVYAAVAGPQDAPLRLVPFAALRGHENGGGFKTNVAAKEWEQLTLATPADRDTTRITLSAADGHQLAQLFGELAQTTTGAHLIAVRELHGKKVSTGSDNVGTIDEVIVEPDRVTTAVVLSPEKDFSLADRRFVVPVHQLNLGARDLNPITTTLARSHFERARQRANDK